MTITTPLEEAAWVYSNHERYTRQQRFDAAVSLAQWGIFSVRQIARIVGVSPTSVAKVIQAKSEKTGGKLDPESLSTLSDLAVSRRRGEQLDPAMVAQAIDAGGGTSTYMASRLTGIPRTHLVRRYEKAKKEAKA